MAEKNGMSIMVLILFFSVGKHPRKPSWFPWQGVLRGTAFLLHKESRGEVPRWLEASNETWVSWRGFPKGGRASLGTRSCLQGLVCYTLDGGRGRKGLVTGQHKTLLTTQDRRVLRAGRPEKTRLAERKSRLADKGCAGLEGAERQESTCSRAVRGV